MMTTVQSTLVHERSEAKLPAPKKRKLVKADTNEAVVPDWDPSRAEKNWSGISRKVIPLVSSDSCTPMRPAYAQEFSPIAVGSMAFHQYPNPILEKKWLEKARDRSYHTFLKELILKDKWDVKSNNVIYFNDDELKRHQVHFEKGKIVRYWSGHEGKAFKPKRYIFVLSNSDKLFAVQKFVTPVGRIQHSSLSNGQPVKCAGWLTFDDHGNLKEISNFTGHYWIKREAVNSLLQFLTNHGIDLSGVEIVFSRNGKAKNFTRYTLDEWRMQIL